MRARGGEPLVGNHPTAANVTPEQRETTTDAAKRQRRA
jgi:hypothetical protein